MSSWLLPQMSDVRRSVMRGVVWTVLANGGDRILGLIGVSILARLLAPGDFGLLGMGFAAIAAVECLTALGFDWVLVRHPDLQDKHLNTAWTLRLIVDAVAALTLVALASPAAEYFHEPRLANVIYVLALCKLMHGFQNIGMVLFRRELRFEKEFQLLFATRMINLAVVMPVAYFQRSYVALLVGLVVSRATAVAMSYVLQPFRPRLSLAARQELLQFSAWVQLDGVLQTIRERAPDFVLGRVVGAHAVAMFSMSSEIANLASTELASPINRAVFSGYSKFSADRDRLRDAFLSVSGLIWLVCLPVTAGIASTAHQIVMLFLGPQWMPAVTVLQLLAVGGLATVLTSNVQFLFLVIGRPAINTLMSLALVVLLIPAVIGFTLMDGVRGAAIGYVAATCVMVPPVFWWLGRVIKLERGDLSGRAWRPTVAAAAMVIVAYLMKPDELQTTFVANLVDLFEIAFVGAVVFVLSVFALWRVSGRPRGPETQLVDLARSMLGARADVR